VGGRDVEQVDTRHWAESGAEVDEVSGVEHPFDPRKVLPQESLGDNVSIDIVLPGETSQRHPRRAFNDLKVDAFSGAQRGELQVFLENGLELFRCLTNQQRFQQMCSSTWQCSRISHGPLHAGRQDESVAGSIAIILYYRQRGERDETETVLLGASFFS